MIVHILNSLFGPFVFTSSAVMTALGFCFLYLKVPDYPALRNYRISRRILAASYLSLAVANALELWINPDLSNGGLIVLVTLIIGAFQAFLFTYTLITLINATFVKFRNVLLESALLLLFAVPWVVAAVYGWSQMEWWAYIVFCLFYIMQLVRYTLLFFRVERACRRQSDDYFSDLESRRLDWVRVAFLGALTVGVMVFLTLLHPGSLFMRIFVIMYVCYYLYFGIRYINYVHTFHIVEPVVTGQDALDDPPMENTPDVEEELALSLEQWISSGQYLLPGVTLGELAVLLNSNRTVLSSFVNKHKQMNFKTWINYLRIEESKRLLVQFPDLPLGEIAQRVGYMDPSSFSRQFSKFEDISPINWRRKALYA